MQRAGAHLSSCQSEKSAHHRADQKQPLAQFFKPHIHTPAQIIKLAAKQNSISADNEKRWEKILPTWLVK